MQPIITNTAYLIQIEDFLFVLILICSLMLSLL